MEEHKLLVYQALGRRMRWKVAVLALVLLVLIVYDQFTEFFGDVWHYLWLVEGAVLALTYYYWVLVGRAAVQVRPKHLRLQGPLFGIKISYGRIHSVTAAQAAQHFPWSELKRGERALMRDLYRQTCAFVELNSVPRGFKRRHLWFSRLLFGTSRPGLVLVVDNWMDLSRDIEGARAHRYAWQESRRRGRAVSPAGRILSHSPKY